MKTTDRNHVLVEARDAIIAVLPHVWAIYVYGSFARGDEWPESDIDLALLLPPDSGLPDMPALTTRICERVGRDVDLVDLREVGDALRAEVLQEGRALYVAQPASVWAWEASAMSQYAQHREEIREILEDFHRTGIGYHR